MSRGGPHRERLSSPRMRGPRLLGRLGLLGTAVTGVVIGHALAYGAFMANPSARSELLADTGHGYWQGAVAAATILGVVSVLWLAIQEARGGAGSRAAKRFSFRGFVVRLIPLQVGLFLLVEVSERVLAGRLHAAPLTHDLLSLGTVLQALVALALALLLRGVAHVARLVAASLTGPEAAAAPSLDLRTLHVAAALPAGARVTRGPPLG